MKKLIILFLSMCFLTACGASNIDKGDDNFDDNFAVADNKHVCNQDLDLIYGGETPETIQTEWRCKTDYDGPKDFEPDYFESFGNSKFFIFKNGQGMLSKGGDSNSNGEALRFDSLIVNNSCSITLYLLDGEEFNEDKLDLNNISFFEIDSRLYVEFKTKVRSYICQKLDGTSNNIGWNE